MSVNWASMMIDMASIVIEKWFGRCCGWPAYWISVSVQSPTTWSLFHYEVKRRQRVKDFWLCLFRNLSANLLQPFINEVLPAIRAKHNSDTLPASPWKWSWTKLQQCMVWHLGNLIGDCLETSINVAFATLRGKTKVICSLPHSENKCQPRVNDFWSCIWCSPTDDNLQTSINEILAACWGTNNSETITSPRLNLASIDYQWFLVSHLASSQCRIAANCHMPYPGCHFIWNSARRIRYPIMKMIFHRASSNFSFANWAIKVWCWFIRL
jgi:hypothetical protein